MVHLKRAVAIFSEVGGDERARLPGDLEARELVNLKGPGPFRFRTLP